MQQQLVWKWLQLSKTVAHTLPAAFAQSEPLL
jgi:hypothetical protein